MNFAGSVVVDSPRETVWRLLEDAEAVSRCIPGLSQFEVIDADHFAAQIAQTVGPVTAVFAMKLAVTERQTGHAIRFDALGKTSRGAVSHLRTNGSVSLSEDGGHTCVTLSADAAVSGVLGTVAEKVLQKQSRKVTEQFGEALRAELGELPGGAGPAGAAVGPAGAAAGPAGGSGGNGVGPAGVGSAGRPAPRAATGASTGRSSLSFDARRSPAAMFTIGVVLGFMLRSLARRTRPETSSDKAQTKGGLCDISTFIK